MTEINYETLEKTFRNTLNTSSQLTQLESSEMVELFGGGWGCFAGTFGSMILGGFAGAAICGLFCAGVGATAGGMVGAATFCC